MTAIYIFLCTICVISQISTHIQIRTEDISLSNTITHFSRLARIVNGMAIIDRASNDRIDVVAEVLKIPAYEMFAKMNNIQRTEEMINCVQNVSGGLPIRQVTTVKPLIEEFQRVSVMQTDFPSISFVSQNVTVDPSKKFISQIQAKAADVLTVESLFVSDSFRLFSKSLGDVLSKKSDNIRNATEKMLPVIATFENVEKNLQGMSEWTSQVGDIRMMMNVAKIVEEYMKNFAKLTVLMTELTKLSADVKSVLPIVKESRRMDELSGALKNISESVELMMEPMGPLELTVGLPGGTADLEQIFKDLDDDWMKKTIADGKDLGKLKKLLEPLNKFTDGVKKVEVSWKNVSGHPGIHKALGLSTDLKTAADNGKTAGDTDPSDAIQAYSTCLTSLQSIKIAVNFSLFEKFFEESLQIDQTLITLRETLISITKEASNLKKLPTATTDELKKVKERFSGYAKSLDSFSSVTSKSLTRLTSPATTLPTIQSAVLESNLIGTFQCLQKIQGNVDQVGKYLKLTDSVITIEKRLSDTKDVLEFLKSLMVMKKTWKEVSGAEKKTVRRRKRTSGGLEDLKNSKQLSIDLGRGVMALKKIEEVRKHKKTVLEVADCGDKVDNLIRTLPQVSALWTTDNKNGLSDMIKEVNDLDKKCSSLHPHDLLNLSTVFDLAADIRGVPIPSQLFSDPIAASLRTSSDPDLLKTADAFQSVSTLQLDFANQLSDLRAASTVTVPIRTFFDRLFGIIRVSNDDLKLDTSTFPDPDISIVIYSGCGSLIAIVLIGSCVVLIFRFKPNQSAWYLKMRYSEVELNKILLLSSRHLFFVERLMVGDDCANLKEAVLRNNYKAARKFVKQGAWVNTCCNTDSLLHVALRKKNIKMLRLLITNGADMKFQNQDRMTAMDLCQYLFDTAPSKEEAVEFSEIMEMFKKLSRKTWFRVKPPLLPLEQYRIYCEQNTENLEFVEKYGSMMTATFDSATHAIVNTDPEGIYEIALNSMEDLSKVFRPTILMRRQWLISCLKDKKNFKLDNQFRVKKLKLNEKIYENVEEVNRLFHCPTVPLLFGFEVFWQPWPATIANSEDRRDELALAILKTIGANETPKEMSLSPYHFPTLWPKMFLYSMPGKYDKVNVLCELNAEHVTIEDIVEMLFSSPFANRRSVPKKL